MSRDIQTIHRHVKPICLNITRGKIYSLLLSSKPDLFFILTKLFEKSYCKNKHFAKKTHLLF